MLLSKREQGRIIGHLVKMDFKEIWKGREWEEFVRFVLSQGVPAHAFLITVPVGDTESSTGYVWFRYEVTVDPTAKKNEAIKLSGPAVADLESEPTREPLEEWKGLPVWRLNP